MDAVPSTGGRASTSRSTQGHRTREDLYVALQNDGGQLAVRLLRLLHRLADHSGVNPTDFQCCTLLRVLGPSTPGEIADNLRLSTGTVTGVIDRLEARGLVERTRHPDDRRKVAVRLVEDFTTPARPGIREAMIALHERYSEEELAIIVDWVERVGHTLEDLIAESDRTR
ncbi:MAG TPA: MarR family transcriptional regulator [Candidatus Nocardiopsis merdipullorum]|nr:MarR family transcriptional regulator [Candidatus Nocardiopsis merdipullorum]